MNVETLGAIFATRMLELVSADGSIRPVWIKIGKPRKYEKNIRFCPYQIIGIGDEKIRYALGSDALQSLILTLTKIGADIYGSPESKARKLTWMEDESHNLGIPVFAEVYGDVVPAPSMSLVL
ncbi:hypothetical protein PO883_05080 [Massilia sp. DJPM01]|uniref:DUF6968 family protein n=1 Tax=Massilia sp. DJPM01 TaxID=3024404 RepID=UPI00259EB1C5|nr:hypothetical protein [Massilia sp. DJPM01]MDM5176568.1 hypothetical protein [Massilia sp. DJPM01]